MPTRARALGQAPQAMGPQEGSQLCRPCCLGLGLGSNCNGGLKGTRWVTAEVGERQRKKRARRYCEAFAFLLKSTFKEQLSVGVTAVKINEGTNLRHILDS